MLSFSAKHDPESKAVVLLGVFVSAYLIVLYGISKLLGFELLLDKTYFNIVVGVIGLAIMIGNNYIFTRNKFHRKNFTYFEKERSQRSFWKEELVFYLFISVWLIGLIIFTAIANPGFKR